MFIKDLLMTSKDLTMDAYTILAFAGLGTTTLVVLSPYLGSRAGSKQEHRRWVREERFRVYEEALTYVQRRRLLLREAVGKGLDRLRIS